MSTFLNNCICIESIHVIADNSYSEKLKHTKIIQRSVTRLMGRNNKDRTKGVFGYCCFRYFSPGALLDFHNQTFLSRNQFFYFLYKIVALSLKYLYNTFFVSVLSLSLHVYSSKHANPTSQKYTLLLICDEEQ